MRRGLAALVVPLALLIGPGPAAASFEEPVSVTAGAPGVVAAGASFPLTVDVTATAGALDIAAQPLRLRVRIAPECGGSFAGTEGPIAIDRTLPAPTPGAPYSAHLSAPTRLGSTGTETICAFLEDAQERQFATDTEETLTVVPPCGVSSRRLTKVNGQLLEVDRRLRAVRRRIRHASGAHRRALQRKLGHLRTRRHVLRARRHRLSQDSAAACTQSLLGEGEGGLIRHFFVIVLENENAENSFGANPPAPYLGKTMRSEGAFIPNYYGTGHASLDNYIAMVSGQPPNLATQADCPIFAPFAPGLMREDGVALGEGCVYPSTVPTVANQLEDSGHTWRGYMQDMAAGAAGEPTSCRHPEIGAADPTQSPREHDQYAARHDPFVYFHSIIDYATCQRNVVDLGRLSHDLERESTTPEYAFITPDLCADGHESSCPDGSPGGFAGIDAFLREWVPRLESSPAYEDHGAILVTFDESASGAGSCCGEANGPNTPNNGATSIGSGGGRVGAVMVSPCIEPGTVTQTAYNHYSMLRWVEDDFGLAHLAEAGTAGLEPFGPDVFTRPSCPSAQGGGEATGTGAGEMRLRVQPRRAVAGQPTVFRISLLGDPLCRQGASLRLAGRRVRFGRDGRVRLRLRLQGRRPRYATGISPQCGRARLAIRVE
ncbi:MAG TPA: alkaline phosphatase family protein [Solirubrobacterales bacterium]